MRYIIKIKDFKLNKKFNKTCEVATNSEINHFDDVEKISILKELLLIIKKFTKCKYIYENQFYINNGILWVLCEYVEKNKTTVIEKRDSGYYDDIMKNVKSILKENKYVDHMIYESKYRFAPLKMDGAVGGLQKANECIYEIRCYVKKEVIPLIIDEIELIIDEIEMYNNVDKYNL
jgi:hypothetical protein